jgi:hypothetical protein
MRIRTVKPEFFLHAELFDAEESEKLPLRLAFIGLWCAADREGRFKWEPRRLKAQVMPYDSCDFSRVLHALATRGFLVHYASNGQEFGAIPSFSRHQVINNRESPSTLPEPTEQQSQVTRAPRVHDACPTPLNLDQGEGKGREGKGKEGVLVESLSLIPLPLPEVQAKQTDDAWLQELQGCIAYEGINVRAEFAKMQNWCAENRKQPTRRRFINWINRCEKPLALRSNSTPVRFRP